MRRERREHYRKNGREGKEENCIHALRREERDKGVVGDANPPVHPSYMDCYYI